MKTFRMFGLALMAVLVSVGFTACGSDGEDEVEPVILPPTTTIPGQGAVNPVVENNVIVYTTFLNRSLIKLYDGAEFGANIVSNTYEGGQGRLVFDGDVTKIGDEAFRGNDDLESIILPNTVTEIGKNAFFNCYDMESIWIGNSVAKIGENAFCLCNCLKSVYITDLEAWCRIDFDKPNTNPLEYAHNLYLNGQLLTNMVIPNSITEIQSSAFRECTSLTSVVIPNSVTKIGYGAFLSCSGLTSVEIGNSVTEIGQAAFYGCTGLRSMVIPASVTEIVNGAFYGCTNLAEITSLNTTPPSIGEDGFDPFDEDTFSNCVLKVPAESVDDYKDDPMWGKFQHIVGI